MSPPHRHRLPRPHRTCRSDGVRGVTAPALASRLSTSSRSRLILLGPLSPRMYSIGQSTLPPHSSRDLFLPGVRGLAGSTGPAAQWLSCPDCNLRALRDRGHGGGQQSCTRPRPAATPD